MTPLGIRAKVNVAPSFPKGRTQSFIAKPFGGTLGTHSAAVTGAAGFIGSHLAEALVNSGARVLAADSRRDLPPKGGPSFRKGSSPGPSPGGRGAHVFIDCDITRKETLEFLAEADTVFHLAAIADPRACRDNLGLAFQVNVEGTRNVLEACRQGTRVIFLSGALTYGEPTYVPVDEDHPQQGTDPYSLTKILGEHLCRTLARQRGLRLTVVRNFSTYGPGQTIQYVIPSMIDQGLTQGKIEVWNADTTRDFTYVDDMVAALLAVARSEQLVGETVNLGSGEAVTTGQLAHRIAQVLGGLPVVDLKKAGAYGGRQVCNNAKLQKATGWRPKVSLEEGLTRTASWLKGSAPSAEGLAASGPSFRKGGGKTTAPSVEGEIDQQIEHSISLHRALQERSETLRSIAALCAEAIRRGGKVILFGNGGSAADAQHIAAELVGKFSLVREPLPALALTTNTSVLTALGNDLGFEAVFARQVRGLARPGDVVVGISTSGNSPNVLLAIEEAKRLGATTVAFTGEGGKLKGMADYVLSLPSSDPARLQEAHIAAGHIICYLIERDLFGEGK